MIEPDEQKRRETVLREVNEKEKGARETYLYKLLPSFILIATAFLLILSSLTVSIINGETESPTEFAYLTIAIIFGLFLCSSYYLIKTYQYSWTAELYRINIHLGRLITARYFPHKEWRIVDKFIWPKEEDKKCLKKFSTYLMCLFAREYPELNIFQENLSDFSEYKPDKTGEELIKDFKNHLDLLPLTKEERLEENEKRNDLKWRKRIVSFSDRFCEGLMIISIISVLFFLIIGFSNWALLSLNWLENPAFQINTAIGINIDWFDSIGVLIFVIAITFISTLVGREAYDHNKGPVEIGMGIKSLIWRIIRYIC